MLRCSTLSHARPTRLLLVLLAVALPFHSVRSQDRAMQDRLERLERDLSMLQRQVYRGGGSPPLAVGHNAAVDTELRMDRLEAEMRDLTGQVENAANGVEQLRRRLEQINSDIDVRFGQGQGVPTSPAPLSRGADRTAVASAAAGTLPTRASPPSASPGPTTAPGSPMPPVTLASPPPMPAMGPGTLTPPGQARLTPESTNNAAAASFRPPSVGA